MTQTAEKRAEPTPGMWAVSGYDTTTVIAIQNGPDRAGHEYIDGRHQYTISRPGDVSDIYEKEANARLFASAKDTAAERDRLKAALEILTRELAPWLTTADAGLPAVVKTLGDCASLHNAQRKARAALAKNKEQAP